MNNQKTIAIFIDRNSIGTIPSIQGSVSSTINQSGFNAVKS